MLKLLNVHDLAHKFTQQNINLNCCYGNKNHINYIKNYIVAMATIYTIYFSLNYLTTYCLPSLVYNLGSCWIRSPPKLSTQCCLAVSQFSDCLTNFNLYSVD